MLAAEASRFFLFFPFLPGFDGSGIIPPRRPFAAALASTSWTVSTFVGSACKSEAGVRLVKEQHNKGTDLKGNIITGRPLQQNSAVEMSHSYKVNLRWRI